MRALRYHPRAPAYRLHTPVCGCPPNTASSLPNLLRGVLKCPFMAFLKKANDYNTATARAAVKTKTRPTRKFWILSAAKKNCEAGERGVWERVKPPRLSQ